VSRSRVIDRFVELEAELVKGAEERLAGLAAVFSADPALAPAHGSKLEAAMAAVRSGGRPRASTEADDERDTADDEDDADTTVDAGPRSGRPVRRGTPVASVGATIPAPIATGPAALPAPEQPGQPGHPDHPEHAEATPSSSDVVSDVVDEAIPADLRLVVGRTPGVTPEDHVAEAGRKVMRFHLARMLAREAGTRAGHEAEELHAMRVATRRQRAAWRVFGGSFRPGRTKRYRNGLREIASRLGAVRDLDVLLEAADLYRADLPVAEQRALEPLLSDWREHRDDARVLLIRELDSDGYHRWVDDYRDFVRTEGAAVRPVGPTQPHRVRDTTASRVWGAYEQVRGYEPVLRWADVETLHELRIAGKWLRYTLEFVREALGDDAAPLIARVTALQDHLGLMNDADVSASMARTFLVEHAGELSPLEGAAIGRYLVSREREVARLRRTIGAPWRGVSGVTFRRKLGRVVSGL
jgi:CHAD domain-containing protein